jgi:hypothetical protein
MTIEPKRTAQPAETVYAEAAAPEDFKGQLEGIKGHKGSGDAAATMAYLGKFMPSARIDGTYLPAIDAVDPTKKKQYEEVVRGKDSQTRDMLAHRLRIWAGVLSSAGDVDAVIESTQQRLERLEALLNKNLKKAFEKIRPLETTYRAVDGFFMNAAVEAGDKVDASFINSSMDQLLDANDRTVFEEGLAANIQTRFRDWTLKETFSNLCIPGWTAAVPNLDRLGLLGSQNKVQVFTDCENYESFKALRTISTRRLSRGSAGPGSRSNTSLFSATGSSAERSTISRTRISGCRPPA